MALILCIDTSTTHASVALAKDGQLLCVKTNQYQREHASFLEPAILSITKETGIALTELDAVAVTSGPGSYTGLRVGLSSAKGLCFALNKPLITISTTEVMAQAAVEYLNENNISHENSLLCPMIDARRMEVFAAVYTIQLEEVMLKQAIVLDKNSFAETFSQNRIFFFGSGADKWGKLCENKHANFLHIKWDAKNMILIAMRDFHNKNFASVPYFTPDYLKEFFTGK